MKRFKYWVIEFVTSVVMFGGLLQIEDEYKDKGVWTEANRNPVFLMAVSVLLSICGLLLTILRTRCVSTTAESLLVVVFAVYWGMLAAGSIIGPAYGRDALNQQFGMQYPQMYFASWACTISSVMSFAAIYKERVYHFRSKTGTQWCLIGSISLYVMLSAIAFSDRTVDAEVPGTNETATVPICTTPSYSCERVELAVILSAVTCPIAFITFAWKNSPLGCETDISLLGFIAWCCGAVYLTFDTGPGTGIGNIYFGTWANLFLCLRIIVVSLSEKESSGRIIRVEPTRNSVVSRGDFFDIAYGQLEISGSADTSPDVRADSLSLYSPVESWSFADDAQGGDAGASSKNEPVLASDAASPSLDDVGPTVQRRNRLELWVKVLIASCVCLAAVIPTLPDSQERDRKQRLELLIPATSILTACTGFLLGMGLFRLEVGMIALSSILWLIGLPVVGRDATLAVGYELGLSDPSVQTSNGISNIFFSSMGCLAVSVLLGTNFFGASQTTTDWVLLSAISFTLTAASMISLRTNVDSVGDDGSVSQVPQCSVQADPNYCERVSFAVLLGAISTGVSLVMTVLYRAPVLLHLAGGLGMLAAWCCGVVMITYGNGQGKTASSTFFATWFALFVSLDITTTNIVLFVKKRDKDRKRRNEQAEAACADDGDDAPQTPCPSNDADNGQEHPGYNP